MRNGYILLHRKGLTQDEWKHPLRTLAWIDLCTLAAWEDREDERWGTIRRGEIVASISFLADRWLQNRGTVLRWIRYWESQQQVQRVTQQPSQQLPQRLFLVNYAAYQDTPQRVSQQVSQQVPQQPSQPIERNNKKEPIERNQKKGDGVPEVVEEMEAEFRQAIPIIAASLDKAKVFTPAALEKWRARRRTFSAQELVEAFMNLQREPDRWKITNNGWRELSWWLHSDARIIEMRNCHLKGSGKASSKVATFTF